MKKEGEDHRGETKDFFGFFFWSTWGYSESNLLLLFFLSNCVAYYLSGREPFSLPAEAFSCAVCAARPQPRAPWPGGTGASGIARQRLTRLPALLTSDPSPAPAPGTEGGRPRAERRHVRECQCTLPPACLPGSGCLHGEGRAGLPPRAWKKVKPPTSQPGSQGWAGHRFEVQLCPRLDPPVEHRARPRDGRDRHRGEDKVASGSGSQVRRPSLLQRTRSHA